MPLLSVSRPSNFSDYIKSNFCMVSFRLCEVLYVLSFLISTTLILDRCVYLFIWLQQASRIEK